MRIAPVATVLILTFATTNAFARRSRCERVVCECTPVVCSSPPVCVKPTTVCGTPRPTVVELDDKAIPVSATAPAEETAKSGKHSKPLLMQDIDPELDAYLADWEKASSTIRRLDCEFLRFRYDPVFEVEKRGRGTIALERDRQARYRVAPVVIKPGDVSTKKVKEGGPYRLEACTAECWHWTGREVFKIDESDHSYEMIPLPSVAGLDPSSNHTLHEVPLAKPFLLGMPVKQLKKRFKIRITKESGDELWLEFVPRRPEDAFNFERAILILDRRSWLPRALKLYDPTGSDIVHVLYNIKVNPFFRDDLSKPKLEGYRQVNVNETTKAEVSK